MVTMSAANTTALKSFDADAFILGFKTPEYHVPMFRRADLVPVLAELDSKIEDLEAKVAEQEKTRTRSFSDKSLFELNRLTEEYNAGARELEDSKVLFSFRPFDSAELKIWLTKQKQLTDEDETDLPIYAEGLALTCTSHPMSAEQWLTLCDKVGGYVFATFGRAWQSALVNGGEAPAPFSPKSSPTPSKESSSSS